MRCFGTWSVCRALHLSSDLWSVFWSFRRQIESMRFARRNLGPWPTDPEEWMRKEEVGSDKGRLNELWGREVFGGSDSNRLMWGRQCNSNRSWLFPDFYHLQCIREAKVNISDSWPCVVPPTECGIVLRPVYVSGWSCVWLSTRSKERLWPPRPPQTPGRCFLWADTYCQHFIHEPEFLPL